MYTEIATINDNFNKGSYSKKEMRTMRDESNILLASFQTSMDESLADYNSTGDSESIGLYVMYCNAFSQKKWLIAQCNKHLTQ